MQVQTPVNPSSTVEALYTKGSSLFVNLRGVWYEYFDKAHLADELKNADSAGQFYNSEIWTDLSFEYRIAGSPAL